MKEASVYWITSLSVIVLLFGFLKSYFLYKIRSYMLCVMFFGIGIVLHSFSLYGQKASFSGTKTVVFKISKKLNSNEKNRKYEAVIRLNQENINAILYIPKSEKELDFIHYYRAQAYLTIPKVPQHDFQFDYAKYLKRNDVDYQCYVNNNVSCAERTDLSIGEEFSQKRLEVLQKIDRKGISSRAKEFLKGIILADRTEIDARTLQDFNRSGLVHFLAISGTHIVVIFGMFYFFLTRFFPLKYRKYAIVLSLIFIWLFTAFIGFGSSVVRSGIMLTVYFMYVLLQRKTDVLHALALSAFIILVFDTQQVFDVGFQLSFLAVLGIYWLNQPILNCFPKQDSWLKKIVFNTVSVSVSAQLVTLPLVLYYFHQFSFISVVANFFIVPFSEIIIIFSFLMTALIAFNFDFTMLNYSYEFTIEILLAVIHWFADFDSLFFENIPMSLPEVFALFVVFFLLRPVILKYTLKNFTRLSMAIFAFLMLRLSLDFYAESQSEILFYDFSKTKIVSVKKSNAVCFWIDKNSDKSKISKFIINPYCASRRIRNVEVRALPSVVQKVVFDHKIYEMK